MYTNSKPVNRARPLWKDLSEAPHPPNFLRALAAGFFPVARTPTVDLDTMQGQPLSCPLRHPSGQGSATLCS